MRLPDFFVLVSAKVERDGDPPGGSIQPSSLTSKGMVLTEPRMRYPCPNDPSSTALAIEFR